MAADRIRAAHVTVPPYITADCTRREVIGSALWDARELGYLNVAEVGDVLAAYLQAWDARRAHSTTEEPRG